MTKKAGWGSTGFGERLKALREGKKLSQHQLAERAGCFVTTISRLERGEHEPAWPLVLILAHALDVQDLNQFNADPAEVRRNGRRKRGGHG